MIAYSNTNIVVVISFDVLSSKLNLRKRLVLKSTVQLLILYVCADLIIDSLIKRDMETAILILLLSFFYPGVSPFDFQIQLVSLII